VWRLARGPAAALSNAQLFDGFFPDATILHALCTPYEYAHRVWWRLRRKFVSVCVCVPAGGWGGRAAARRAYAVAGVVEGALRSVSKYAFYGLGKFVSSLRLSGVLQG
jgi:hypothetical protein